MSIYTLLLLLISWGCMTKPAKFWRRNLGRLDCESATRRLLRILDLVVRQVVKGAPIADPATLDVDRAVTIAVNWDEEAICHCVSQFDGGLVQRVLSRLLDQF
jgi:hypothetical protein